MCISKPSNSIRVKDAIRPVEVILCFPFSGGPTAPDIVPEYLRALMRSNREIVSMGSLARAVRAQAEVLASGGEGSESARVLLGDVAQWADSMQDLIRHAVRGLGSVGAPGIRGVSGTFRVGESLTVTLGAQKPSRDAERAPESAAEVAAVRRALVSLNASFAAIEADATGAL